MELNEQELLEEIMAMLAEQAEEEGVEISEEDLMELSKKTLSSYVKKAASDVASSAYSAGAAYGRGDGSKDPGVKDVLKTIKRVKGIDKASGKLAEEEIEEHLIDVLGEEEYMQLDELSKKTLGNYIGKATQSYANHSVSKARHERDAETIGRMSHNAPDDVRGAVRSAQDASYKAQYAADNKRIKRGQGILKAVDRLTKEELEEHLIEVLGEEDFMQLDEISKKTLGSYINKATTQAISTASSAGASHTDASYARAAEKNDRPHMDHYNKELKIALKRKAGINRAVSKLTKESVNEMIAAAHEQKHTTFSEAFNAAMYELIGEKLEAMRFEVAAGLVGDSE